jgi:RimJ/RimL family protein N-acetyltransferase
MKVTSPTRSALHLDPEVSRYLGGIRSPETTRAYLRANLAHWNRHGFGLWVLRTQTGEFACRAGIRRIVVDDEAEVEVAYTLKRTLWGQGLASQFANPLTNIGLTHFKLASLVGVVAVGNGVSGRVLEKLGYNLERSTIYYDARVVIYRRSTAALSEIS